MSSGPNSFNQVSVTALIVTISTINYCTAAKDNITHRCEYAFKAIKLMTDWIGQFFFGLF